MSFKKYRIAVIGHTGHGNYGHGIDTVWNELPNVEIVGVADANPAGLKAAKRRLKTDHGFADYRQLLTKQEPDIVAICPRWLDQHHQMCLEAIDRGVHIYMEKPFCRNLTEADEIVKACEKKQIKLAIAHQTRYSPKLPRIKQIIESGAIGKVLEIRGRGKEDRRGGGEDLWVLGSHIMNLIHYFGGEPTWCFGQVENKGKRAAASDVVAGAEGIGPLTGDHLRAMYGLENGITGYFSSTRNSAGGRFGIQIMGSKGIIELLTGYLPQAYILQDPNWSPGRSKKEWRPISSAGIGEPEPLAKNKHTDNIVACQDLIQSIEEDRLPECNYYEARTTVEMIAGVFESHRLARQVTLPLENRKNPLTLLE